MKTVYEEVANRFTRAAPSIMMLLSDRSLDNNNNKKNKRQESTV